MKTKMINISANIPIELLERLNNITIITERSKNYYIKKALERYLEDIEDLEDAKKEYAEFKASGEKAISWEEIKSEIEK